MRRSNRRNRRAGCCSTDRASGLRVGAARQRSIDIEQDVAQKDWLHTKKHFVLAVNAEHTFERNDNEDLATVIQARNGRIRSRVVHRKLGERAVRVKALAVRHAELASGKLGVAATRTSRRT